MKAGSVDHSETQAVCEAILRRLDDYIDRELSPSDMQMVERHIEECLRCAGQYRFEISLIKEIRSRLRRVRLPGDLLTRVKLRLDAETAG
jgi:anti-sigma factor (TIGR02949 family)